MSLPKVRLIVAAGLFVAWLLYLAFLVLESSRMVVLSRPQFLVADLCVLADVKETDGHPAPDVTVTDVFWALDAVDAKLKGQSLRLPNLPDCGEPQGYRGPGSYVIPVTKRKLLGQVMYAVTPVPPSPGYAPSHVNVMLADAGPNRDAVARLVAEFLGESEAEARKQLDLAGDYLKKNVPRDEALEFQAKMNEAKAMVRLSPNDARLYPATPQTLQQLDEVRPR